MPNSNIFLLAAVTAAACGSPLKPSKSALDTCSQQWDLGSGSASEIERLAPELAGTRWGFQAMTEAELPESAIVRRIASFNFEIKMPPLKEPQLRALRPLREGSKKWLILIPGECHRLLATKSCDRGRPKMTITTDGTLQCVDGRAIEASEVTADLRTTTMEKLAPTPATALPPLVLTAVTSIPKDVPVFLRGSPKAITLRTTTTFHDVSEEEVLAIAAAELPLGRFVEDAYRALKNVSPSFDKRLAEARLASVKAYLPKIRPKDVRDLVYGGDGFLSLPGEEQIHPLVVAHLMELLEQAADGGPSKHDFATLLNVIRLHERLAGAPAGEAMMRRLESVYGPTMPHEDEEDQAVFLHVFPASSFADAVRSAQAERRKAALAATEAKEKQWRMAIFWDSLETQGDQLAQLKYKIRYAAQHFSDTTSGRRGVKNMQLHHAAIAKDSFCPAKREFIKLTSASEFNERSQAHCKEDPPTIWTDSGEEVPLTAECRDAFSSGC